MEILKKIASLFDVNEYAFGKHIYPKLILDRLLNKNAKVWLVRKLASYSIELNADISLQLKLRIKSFETFTKSLRLSSSILKLGSYQIRKCWVRPMLLFLYLNPLKKNTGTCTH